MSVIITGVGPCDSTCAKHDRAGKVLNVFVTVVGNYLLVVHIEYDNFCYCLGCAIVCIKVHSSRINRDLMKM